MIMRPYRSPLIAKESPIPVPKAEMSALTSLLERILSSRARSVFKIFPRRGRIHPGIFSTMGKIPGFFPRWKNFWNFSTMGKIPGIFSTMENCLDFFPRWEKFLDFYTMGKILEFPRWKNPEREREKEEDSGRDYSVAGRLPAASSRASPQPCAQGAHPGFGVGVTPFNQNAIPVA